MAYLQVNFQIGFCLGLISKSDPQAVMIRGWKPVNAAIKPYTEM